MFLGIDLGTSAVKAVLLDRAGGLVAQASAALTVEHPHPRWSEQDPEQWWSATLAAVDRVLMLAADRGVPASALEAIGLSGQMHGAVLLDARGDVLRPAMLWNDGRADLECVELESNATLRGVTGNLAMPGFTAPKLLWLRRHEPEVFARIDTVLLPKDYLRYRLTGERVTDPSDASGTLWLNVATRRWDPGLLAACGLHEGQLPRVVEGSRRSANLRPQWAERWSTACVPVAAGGGDNAAGAVGVGVVRPGQAMLSLGTSGVCFAVSDGPRSAPELTVHSFCHALPDTWHLMSVMLNAASCLDVAARLGGHGDVQAMLDEAEATAVVPGRPWFLPYLAGERTPHNDPHATGCWHGITSTTRRADMTHAVLEGVGLGLLDGLEALQRAGAHIETISVIGGGTRSAYWLQMLADILGKPLQLRSGGGVGPALGAARLARMAVDGDDDPTAACPQPPLQQIFEPRADHHERYLAERQPVFRQLYARLRGLGRQASAGEHVVDLAHAG